MIFEAETALLVAVRLRLIDQLHLDESIIDIELDDIAPAIAGDLYFAVSPAQAQAGRHSQNADQAHHNLFGVRVAVLKRIGNVPRDRRRHVFLDRLRGINAELSRVNRAIRFDYHTLNLANLDLARNNISGSFIRPLVPTSVDGKPRLVTGDIYDSRPTGSHGDLIVAMVRGITFSGAEFVGREST